MENSGKYVLYKVTKILLVILLIPALIVSLSCAIAMFQTKSNEGIGTFLNYCTVESNNNYFTDPNNGQEIKNGDDLLFQFAKSDSYKRGNIILFDITASSSDNIIQNAMIDTEFGNQGLAESFNGTTTKTESNTPTANVFTNHNGYETITLENGSQVCVAVVNYCSQVTVNEKDENGETVEKTYNIYVVSPEGNLSEDVGVDDVLKISTDRVIGKLVQVNSFVSSYINLCVSENGFLFLIVLPLGILLLLAMVSMIFANRYSNYLKKEQKEIILDQEITKEKSISGSETTRQPPKKRPTKETHTKVVEDKTTKDKKQPPKKTPSKPSQTKTVTTNVKTPIKPKSPAKPTAPTKPTTTAKPSTPPKKPVPSTKQTTASIKPKSPAKPTAPTKPTATTKPTAPTKPTTTAKPSTPPKKPIPPKK